MNARYIGYRNSHSSKTACDNEDVFVFARTMASII